MMRSDHGARMIPAMTTRIFRAKLREREGELLVLAPTDTAYELSLVAAGHVEATAGQRVSGHMEAVALAIHPATAGGRFIEPIQGQPRIVAGRVIEVDQAAGRVLLESVVPMTLSIQSHADMAHCIERCSSGEFVNCHVDSGSRFVPSRDA